MAGGRPSKYRKENAEQAYKLALLGATDAQIADFFGVKEQTVNNWKKSHKEFFESLKAGKDEADAVIAQSLFHRAKGYTHPEEKIFNHNGTIVRADTLKHYPPDTTACIFWLKNRQKDVWRDGKELDLSNKDGSLTPSTVELVAKTTDEKS